MFNSNRIHSFQNIEFKVIYSGRRTLGISILPDSSVIVRVPYLTSQKTINRLVSEKTNWIIKHRDNYRNHEKNKITNRYVEGEIHLFRGNKSILKIEKSKRPFVRFYENTIEIGLTKTDDPSEVKKLLYKGYKSKAVKILPEIITRILDQHNDQIFKPSGFVIRTMKRRWGSCSNKGVITLSTELIKLSDLYIEYVIIHELCHLRHHNHGAGFYKLLTELYPEWKSVRKGLKKYIM